MHLFLQDIMYEIWCYIFCHMEVFQVFSLFRPDLNLPSLFLSSEGSSIKAVSSHGTSDKHCSQRSSLYSQGLILDPNHLHKFGQPKPLMCLWREPCLLPFVSKSLISSTTDFRTVSIHCQKKVRVQTWKALWRKTFKSEIDESPLVDWASGASWINHFTVIIIQQKRNRGLSGENSRVIQTVWITELLFSLHYLLHRPSVVDVKESFGKYPVLQSLSVSLVVGCIRHTGARLN